MTMKESIARAKISGPQRQAGGGDFFEFSFDADDPVFAGHFPGRPILPGVFQLEMARAAVEAVADCRLAVREITKAKFQRPISPAETVRVELKLAEKDGVIQARAGFSVDGQPAGETILILARNA